MYSVDVELPALKVSENKRYLMNENNEPFFWLGDTGWLLFSKLKREEVELYFDNRVANGFNLIQVMLLHSLDVKNAYNQFALFDNDVARPLTTIGNDVNDSLQYDYWDHVDYIVELAAKKGLYLGLVPIWGSNVRAGRANVEQAEQYARFLAERYGTKTNIVWLNGGDVRATDAMPVWQKIGKTLKAYAPKQLMTFHPFGRTQSSTWFNNESWLDFNMFQSGHRRYSQDTARIDVRYGEDNWRYVVDDLSKLPAKPTIDGEPSYEGIPHGLHDTLEVRWSKDDLRRYAYWSVFSGAFGFTYGHNSVMQFYAKSPKSGAYGARQTWIDALTNSGADQMKHLKHLMLKYRYFDLVPMPEIINKQGEKYDYQPVLKGESVLLVYCYNGRTVHFKNKPFKNFKLNVFWYSPKTGDVVACENRQTASLSYTPPGVVTNANDWVLVVEKVL